MPVSMFTLNPGTVQKEIADGCNFMLVCTDAVFMTSAAKETLKLVRKKD
jgi:hypothetical protein